MQSILVLIPFDCNSQSNGPEIVAALDGGAGASAVNQDDEETPKVAPRGQEDEDAEGRLWYEEIRNGAIQE